MNKYIDMPSHMLRAALVCVADNPSRLVFTGVHITPEIMEASNGHVAVRMTHGCQCDRDITVIFKGKIPRAAEITRIYPGDTPMAEHINKKGDVIGMTACQVLDAEWPSARLAQHIPDKTDTSTVAVLDTRYLAFPDKMFGTGQGRKQIGCAVCPAPIGCAVRLRFDKATTKLFGNPAFIVMPIRYDGETGLE
ncbi:hypothetical protein NEN25_25200 [Escherichia coli]|nr:hypothetical protein [Escherichia coli]MEB7231502.1 hypothetical protein [Escherichia coli]